MSSTLINGDCLEYLPGIPDSSVDLVLADPPYGTTACSWDSVIPLEPMWKELKRIMKDHGSICLFGSEPFSSQLRLSNVEMFRYDWIWEKSSCSNFLHAKYQPLRSHEIISVFTKLACVYNQKGSPKYHPSMIRGLPYKTTRKIEPIPTYRNRIKTPITDNKTGERYPRSIQFFRTANSEENFHPTQKPVALMEYLVRTYTDESDTVLDFCMGSGTTGVAAINLDRIFIGIEKDQKYFQTAEERIRKIERQKELVLF